jgi:predicted membrane GTPase involved in stress response
MEGLAKSTSSTLRGTPISAAKSSVSCTWSMAACCVVDAYEGTMPQTRFVLKNALENHIKPIVVINKVDRPNADPKKAVDEVLDLFIELGAPDDLLDFPIVYVSALNGTSSLSPDPATQKPAWPRFSI